MLLPALSKAKSKAVSIKCQSNLKQYGLALNMYVNDFERYPSGGGPNTNDWWPILLRGYYFAITTRWSPEIENCPANKAPAAGYGYNSHGVGLNLCLGINAAHTVSASAVRVPSEMIALGDGFKERESEVHVDGDIYFGINFTKSGLWKREPYATHSTNWPRQRHNSRANVVFCDGHIESWKIEKLFLDRGGAILRKWNSDNEPHAELLLKPR